ncbi:MAG TPA: MYXO-CTERM sorting domain-containing protein [Polyangiaceae bacterium LLY-WYZ-15_(1-7)]|nr:hypothetical protein [Sandaracinus sp.]HJK89834.1 MYXO-CTERM sorting domain-containing protein [Polyangiaceae bacterium LLY-WYZ-15_(1-7)]HJL00332.1 MYXO-CTERM sorting domain-containing protein [Polyangiaceae bacterium LLY-WYZ-15_(1-7)]HJL06884.1 MYXO-CTERM sorting domain-containing protein [Polyangiaceae bacterium LLY-WYZ-15_(1-7)]
MFVLMACGGGGCSGCDGCGVEPIPGGFPIEQRVPNSAQIRLTSSGIEFMESNADALVGLALPDGLEFEVPPTTTTVDATVCEPEVRVCQSGDCVIQGEIANLDIQPIDPNQLSVTVRVELQSRRCTARDGDGTCIESERGPLDIRTSGGFLGACSGGINADIDTLRGDRRDVGLELDILFEQETEAARAGYTKVTVTRAGLEDGRNLEDADIDLDGDGGLIDILVDVLGGLLRGIIVGALEDQVSGIVQDTIEDQLCTRTGETGCPTGTVSDDPADPESLCRFSEGGECVPILLGTDGQGDLGAAFLGSISPGTHAPGQFLLASGGEGEAVNDGMSLFFYGGFLGTSRDFETVYPHNPCVPVVEPPPIPTIPRVGTFRGNSVPGLAEDPHVGIGLSESFLNHAGYGAFDAGLLCIGAGTPLSQQLSTGLFSLLVPSLNRLTFPDGASPLAVLLRPQTPPTFEIGEGTAEDPLLDVSLEQLQVDFYVWSNERFIRFMTYQADLSIDINLSVVDGEIVPEILGLEATNSTVTNQEDLLTERPEALADIIQDVLSSFASMAFGDLGGFALPDLMGLQLDVQEGGVRGIEEGGEEFLGIFANLAVADPMALSAPVETRVEVSDLTLDPVSMHPDTWRQGEMPYAHLWFDGGGPAGVELEYSWRIDGKPWSRWTTERHVVIEDPALLFQARHELEARARVVGEPESVDLTPARAEILVDLIEPEIWLERGATGVRVQAWDIVSDQLEMRWRMPGDEAWSEWQLVTDEMVIDALEAEVEVRDEAGNVGSASSALIRGRANPNADAGCACAVPGEKSNAPFSALALLGALGLVLRRRRKGLAKGRATKAPKEVARHARSFLFFVLPLTLAIAGCDCGDGGGGEMVDAGPMVDGEVPDDAGPPAALVPGLLATHLDMAALDDGSLVLSGYSPGAPPRSAYGDLVIGVYDAAGESVDWEIVDGVPDEAPTGDPTGWRGGISAAGDDVGTFTSVVGDGANVHVTYFDRTNGALKFATGTPGGEWSTHTVDDDGFAGEYSSLTLASGGPAVSYLGITAPAMLPGRPVSEVRVATASGVPSGPTDWTITDVVTAEIDCRPELCPEGSTCLESGECVMPSSDCTEECADDTACVMGSCEAALPEDFIEDLAPAVGLFTSMAPTSGGLALVYYDRAQGNLMGVEFDGSAWGEPFLIDGYGVGDPDIGDSGLSATLAVDAAGVWHVAYVDGAEETLRYARIEGGTATTEIVDDGSTDGTDPNPDGRHVVGDDADLVVTDGGEVRITYQDATAQRTMFARKSGEEWALSVLDDSDSTGYFTSQVLLGTTSFVAAWWRQEARDSRDNGVRVYTVD